MTRYQVELPTWEYYKRGIKCQAGCPAGTNARAYVLAIGRGEYERAYHIARQCNPFASVCGRVCSAPCEAACRRGDIDEPVAIRALKRYVAQQYGTESPRFKPYHVEALLASGAADSVKASDLHALQALRQQPGRQHGKVAVVGAGPGGLAAAHDLALLGHQVHVFEASEKAGGMLRYGIPAYRLPRDLLDAEIQFILDLGVTLHTETRLGSDLTLPDLRSQGFGVTFLAVGAQTGRDLRVPGEELPGVEQAVDFLRRANSGQPANLGRRIVVVGGGNAAMDAARLALRLGPPGCTVTVVYRRTRAEMPAAPEEIAEAMHEGVRFQYLTNPVRLLPVEGGETLGEVECIRMRLGAPDESGRRRPEPIPGSEFRMEADRVIVAIGQAADLGFMAGVEGLQATRGGAIRVTDCGTMETGAPAIFAGGDAVAVGPLIAIQAVADGLRAARAIDAFLQGRPKPTVRTGGAFHVVAGHRMADGYQGLRREAPPLLPKERRTASAEVEDAYDRWGAQRQSDRCLRCHVQTVFHSDRCILCGGCVDVCPEQCLKMVRLDRIAGNAELQAAVETRYGAPLEAFWRGWAPKNVLQRGTAMVKDETRCIRCGLCERRCPTKAITMEAFRFEETLVFEEELAAEAAEPSADPSEE
ncbi:MAG: FAD-dependent oxidoreductase [Chloroflexi bacterium]|nr:FAD-dependent oxidoreductase [Chloroflexota bacterium]